MGLFALPSLKALRSFDVRRHVGSITALAWSPNADLLAVSGDDGRVQLWSVAGRPKLVLSLLGLPRSSTDPKSKQQLHEAAKALSFSPDGRLLAAGYIKHTPGFAPPDGHLAIWRAASGRLVAKTLDLGSRAEAVAFSPDTTRVAVGLNDGRVLIVDSTTGRTERTIKGGDEVVSLAFAPDGTLEVGTWAGIVQRFDVSRGIPLDHPTLVTPSPVASLSFDPSGDTFSTTGGSDGTAKLWTTSTVQQLGATFQPNAGHWGNAVFAPGGRYLLVVYEDGTGFLWPTTVSAWEDHACAVAGRNFTREEWRRFVAGHSYAKTCPAFPGG